jgi:hypothetical protein
MTNHCCNAPSQFPDVHGKNIPPPRGCHGFRTASLQNILKDFMKSLLRMGVHFVYGIVKLIRNKLTMPRRHHEAINIGIQRI